ncbi:hypothetical protein B0A50_01127 [Salinomyces thailandicus]|uniref:Uncharacterized protein n=1 Tax=Salinomyces thailandicus TaxID=706561 RepID=A0A4U0UBQ9_9PEZI|nr:hypothetical protein B0A50_01127 [Salinomyces thailandica]
MVGPSNGTAAGLMTPAAKERSFLQFETPRLQDSPFSDYFTDDARSVGESAGKRVSRDGYSAPSVETQALLVRLGRLQSQLMRGGESEQRAVVGVVARKLGEMEREISELQGRKYGSTPGLEDSGVFMEEDEEGSVMGSGIGEAAGQPRQDAEIAEPSANKNDDAMVVVVDRQLDDARQVLTGLTKAQEELRRRHSELKDLNDSHVEQLAEHEQAIETLRCENEGLKSELGFGHSELLYLKLQMEALEVDVQSLEPSSADGVEPKREDLRQATACWRRDWCDVDARLKSRLSAYGVAAAGDGDSRIQTDKTASPGHGWRLEVVREGEGGKVGKVTLQRLGRGMEEEEEEAGGVDGVKEREGESRTARAASDQREQHESAAPSYSYYYRPDNEPASYLKENNSNNDSNEQSTKQGEESLAPASSVRNHQLETANTSNESPQSTQHPTASRSDAATQTPSPSADLAVEDDSSDTDGEEEAEGEETEAESLQASAPVSAKQLQQPPRTPQPSKSAWAELWEGIGHLAGGRWGDDED